MNKLCDAIIDFALPPCCPCCGDLVGKGVLVCAKCEEQLKRCKNENTPPLNTTFSASAFYYEGAAKQGVLAMKNNEGRAFAKYAAAELAPVLKDAGATLVTAVPMSIINRLSRGTNQSEVFGRCLAAELGVPFEKGLLRCSYSRSHQHELPADERHIHAETVYDLAPGARKLTGEKVILCDDIITTGATIEACARLLLKLGADEVSAASVCKTAKK